MSVNGKIVENPDHWIEFGRDRVEFDGKPLERRERVYILLNKPTGYITTFKDPEGRPTVYDLIRDVDTFISPVGRLDLDTSGLLILTNDTQFAERLTNPDHEISKTYLVTSFQPLPDEALEQLRQGLVLDDGPTRPADVNRRGETEIEITITEGRNRQVRRMIEAAGGKVNKLERLRIGHLAIGDLARGKWRFLTGQEVHRFSPPPYGR